MTPFKLKYLSIAAALASSSVCAANYAIEARGDAMGGVGVVSANFLTAPFYNPALTAIYRRNDDVGMILPSVGISYNDEEQVIDGFETIADQISSYYDSPSAAGASELQQSLDDINGDTVDLELGGVVSFAIPNQYISMNVFGKAYLQAVVQPDMYSGANTGDSNLDIAVNAELSTVNAVSVGVTEAGISLAKYQNFLGQHIAVGVSPKIQRIYTLVYNTDFANFSIDDIAKNRTGETMFNLDAGMIWFYGPFRVGVSGTNLISRDIETKRISKTLTASDPGSSTRDIDLAYYYKMRPQFTVGAGIVADYFTLSVDYDLREEDRFTSFDDNKQMLRIGGELDLLRQLKLRAGWNRNLAYTDSEDTLTAGVGINLLGLVQLDVGASYTNPDAMGAYVNFLASY